MGVRPNGSLIKQIRNERGMTQEELATVSEISKRWIEMIEKGQPTEIETLGFVAKALECDVEPLVRPAPEDEGVVGAEWEMDKRTRIGRQQVAANGLRYEVFRVPSRRVRGRVARAKLYDRTSLATIDAERARAQLERHSEVCHRLRNEPYFARLITSVEDEQHGYWWILDEWVEGSSFVEHVRSDPPSLPFLMEQVARALDALHRANVIRRALTPSSIIVAEGTSNVVLTDFELGKLMEAVPTVSPDAAWLRNDFIATEVLAGGDVGPQADWYSWGMLVVAGIADKPVTDQDRVSIIQGSDLPSEVQEIVLRCIEISPTKRPVKAAAILKSIKRWK